MVESSSKQIKQSNVEKEIASLDESAVHARFPQRKNKRWLKAALAVCLIAVASFVLFNLTSQETQIKVKQQVVSAPPLAVVKVTDRGFSPATIIVKRGTVVVWKASDLNKTIIIASDPYPSDNKLPGLKSNQLGNGASYRFKFSTAGTYTYHDDTAPDISGTVLVE